MKRALLLMACALLSCSHADADVRKTLAAECATERDCPAGVPCREGMCEPVPGVVRCIDERECPGGQSCINGACTTPRSGPGLPPPRPIPGR